MTTVIGIDPGLTRCGFALVTSGPKAISYGVFRSDPTDDTVERIAAIAGEVEQLIVDNRPTLLVLEEVFAGKNLHSVMSVAQVSGAIMFLAKSNGLAVEVVTPTAVKMAVTGSGTASKSAVTSMVRRLFALAEDPRPADAADALAIALAGLQRRQTSAQQRWVEATQRSRR